MNKHVLRLLGPLCFLSLLAAAISAEEKKPAVTAIEFGIAPQHSATDLSLRWTPVFDYLSKKTGYELRFRTGKDVPTYQRECIDGKYDMIYINPFHYANLIKPKSGYEAFAREKGGALTGAIVVRKDSPYQSMRDLHGKDVALPGRTAIVATLMPLEGFKSAGAQVKEVYVASHESAFQAVAKGLYAAGGGDTKTFNGMKPELREQLRILWTAQPLPPLVFAAHPRVPKKAVRAVQKAMLSMDKDPEGRKLLESLKFQAIEAARDADYDVVRNLKLKIPGQG